MAYDKVVDSAVLDAGLKAIADAIREKGGTSDNLDFYEPMVEAIKAIEAGAKIAYASITFAEDNANRPKIIHNLGQIPNLYIFYSPDAEPTISYVYVKAIIMYCVDIDDPSTYYGLVVTNGNQTTSWSSGDAGRTGFGINGGRKVTDYGSANYWVIAGADADKVYLPGRGKYSSNLALVGGATYNLIVGVV